MKVIAFLISIWSLIWCFIGMNGFARTNDYLYLVGLFLNSLGAILWIKILIRELWKNL